MAQVMLTFTIAETHEAVVAPLWTSCILPLPPREYHRQG
jgi:hypothetical protein